MGRDIDEKAKIAAQNIFTITPCFRGVVSNHTDKTLIQPFVLDVLQAADELACCEIAAHVSRSTNTPVLTVGDGKELVAVYPTGEVETICLSNLTAQN